MLIIYIPDILISIFVYNKYIHIHSFNMTELILHSHLTGEKPGPQRDKLISLVKTEKHAYCFSVNPTEPVFLLVLEQTGNTRT